MRNQRQHFEPFVAALRTNHNAPQNQPTNQHIESKTSTQGMNFNAYMNLMSRDAVWGGDPEITAMCELYSRPAEIYAYDAQRGFRLLRTFHEERRTSRCPMRLSYYGGGHYDSIMPLTTNDAELRRHRAAQLQTRPGIYEQRRIALTGL